MNEPFVRDVDYVADLLSQTPEFIRSQCRNGKIKAQKIGKRWMISQTEINRLLQVEPMSSSTKNELIFTKLEIENRELKTQLAAIRSLLKGANEVLGN